MLIKLGNMEDDKKKFVNWLKQLIKIDGVITGKALAAKIKVDPSTVSGWLTGRTKGPELPVRIEICEAVSADYKEIMQTQNNKELQPNYAVPPEDVAGIVAKEIKRQLAKTSPAPPAQQNDLERRKTQKNQPHHDLVNEFEQPEEAYELNCIIRKIEKLEKNKFKKIKKYLLAELEELEELKMKNNNHQEPDQENKMG